MNIKGKFIKGKWNKNHYEIINLIGLGGVGEVYRVYQKEKKSYYALKISQDLNSISKEANMLERFKALNSIPQIIEIDDYEEMGDSYYFIVLEYINGINLKEYIKRCRISIKELLAITIIIGESIRQLHRVGYIYGDLKPENIMVDKEHGRIKIIDLGGVCKIGDSLKEFTPIYDRAKWNVGMRCADTGYDLFALCMLITNFLLKNKSILNMNINEIIMELKNKKIDKRLLYLLEKGLLQKRIKFNYFIETLKTIYDDYDEHKILGNSADYFINSFFCGSIICFIIMLTIIFFG